MPETTSAASSSISRSEIISAPCLKLLDEVLLSLTPFSEKTADTTMLPSGLKSQVSSPNELNIMMLLSDHAVLASTLTALESFALTSVSSFPSMDISQTGLHVSHPVLTGYKSASDKVLGLCLTYLFPSSGASACAICAAALAAHNMSAISVLSEYEYPVLSPFRTRMPTP